MELDNEYKNWLSELKLKIRSAQMKAAIAVNKELILFYWDLGNMLSDKIKTSNWGDKVLENVSKDLKDEFPEMKGFSVTNLKYCKLFYEYFQISPQLGDQLNSIKNTISQQAVDQLQNTEHQENIKSQHAVDQIENEQTINRSQAVNHNRNFSIIQQLVAQIPWGHIIIIIAKIKDTKEAIFYIQKTKENNWSRDVLSLQIKSNLYQRQGTAINNFSSTPPEPFSDLARQTL